MGLKAAMANQSALASLRDYRLRGALAAGKMLKGWQILIDLLILLTLYKVLVI